MAHIIMENADKKIKLLIICYQLKIADILLSFFLWASLYLIATVAKHDLQCAIVSCELQCAVACCDVRVRTYFFETCNVGACGAFLGLRMR